MELLAKKNSKTVKWYFFSQNETSNFQFWNFRFPNFAKHLRFWWRLNVPMFALKPTRTHVQKCFWFVQTCFLEWVDLSKTGPKKQRKTWAISMLSVATDFAVVIPLLPTDKYFVIHCYRLIILPCYPLLPTDPLPTDHSRVEVSDTLMSRFMSMKRVRVM